MGGKYSIINCFCITLLNLSLVRFPYLSVCFLNLFDGNTSLEGLHVLYDVGNCVETQLWFIINMKEICHAEAVWKNGVPTLQVFLMIFWEDTDSLCYSVWLFQSPPKNPKYIWAVKKKRRKIVRLCRAKKLISEDGLAKKVEWVSAKFSIRP